VEKGDVFKINSVYRNFGKIELIDLFAKTLKTYKGAEIGVFNGDYSTAILRCMPELTLYMVDSYKKYPDDVYPDELNMPQAVHNARYNLVKVIEKELYPGRAKILRKTSMSALSDVEDESLDFVFIDANHQFVNVYNDIVGWGRKVRPGGWISGHDFHDMLEGVKQAVWTYCSEMNINSFKVGQYDFVWLIKKKGIEDATKN